MLRDVDRLIAHPLEIVIDLHDGGDETQIFGHRLVERQELQAIFFKFDLRRIDFLVALHHLGRDIRTSLLQGNQRFLNSVDHGCSDGKNPPFQVLDLVLQMF